MFDQWIAGQGEDETVFHRKVDADGMFTEQIEGFQIVPKRTRGVTRKSTQRLIRLLLTGPASNFLLSKRSRSQLGPRFRANFVKPRLKPSIKASIVRRSDISPHRYYLRHFFWTLLRFNCNRTFFNIYIRREYLKQKLRDRKTFYYSNILSSECCDIRTIFLSFEYFNIQSPVSVTLSTLNISGNFVK